MSGTHPFTDFEMFGFTLDILIIPSILAKPLIF